MTMRRGHWEVSCDLFPCASRWSYHGADLGECKAQAAADGWTVDAEGRDVCPGCTEQKAKMERELGVALP